MICKKCVLPEHKPDIWLNAQGVCNVCLEDEKEKSDQAKFLETDFIKLLKMYKSRGEYDCLVMCSGGKDSTSALYYMKKRYKLNPLAFTFDHGFETQEALENVKNAVEILGVDCLFFKSDFMHEMFREMVKTNSRAVICHPCSIWYMDLAFKTAFRYNIPVIIAGWTKGQSSKQPLMSRCGCNIHQPEFSSMGQATKEFLEEYIRNNPKYNNFPKNMEEVLKRAKLRQKCVVLSPHWFLPFDPQAYVKLITEELKWKLPKLSYPLNSTNCYLNFISVHNSMKHYGYTHYHVEMSKLIREGLLSRQEALKNLEVNFSNDLLNSIAAKLDYRFSD
ncbi:MAG TPA: 7-cyano-7-deazaguanine synthase [Candidatus Omnitrophota bacterium]|nr:7-cyano-7-deazaguanine synthase [Candidatus Omnitrophota bacterium]HPT39398.1 7-cyano-7-deazaguanine synthase [Candidatus Omnitrophota bacterium]